MEKPIDYALKLLLAAINSDIDVHHNTLWLADEHVHTTHLRSVAHPSRLSIISNRFDLIQQAKSIDYKSSTFSDFIWSSENDCSYAKIYLRLPKEKLLYQHLLKISFQALKLNGQLFLAGAKQEGLQSASQYAQTIFSTKAEKITREQTTSLLMLTKHKQQIGTEVASNYFQDIRLPDIQTIAGNPLLLFSKPGQYGWRKTDVASQLLAAQFARIHASFNTAPQKFLDLGCGYGYLTLLTKDFNIAQRTATDNNAAALYSCKNNCIVNNINCAVIASDAGENLIEKYDWIVCNPPFHSGFFNNPELLNKFIRQSKALLNPVGKASFVTNEFVPLQREAANFFKKITLIQRDKGFNIHVLEHS